MDKFYVMLTIEGIMFENRKIDKNIKNLTCKFV